MAYKEPMFAVLKDSAGCGVGWDALQVGGAPAGKNGGIAYSFIDSSGNVVLPQLTSDGKLPVSLAAAGTCKSGTGKVTATALNADDIVATIAALTVSKDHVVQFMSSSAFFPTEFSIVQTNDAVETILHRVLVGPGDYNESQEPVCLEFTTGATGTQQIEVRANQLSGCLSDVVATVAVLEKA